MRWIVGLVSVHSKIERPMVKVVATACVTTQGAPGPYPDMRELRVREMCRAGDDPTADAVELERRALRGARARAEAFCNEQNARLEYNVRPPAPRTEKLPLTLFSVGLDAPEQPASRGRSRPARSARRVR